jgi:hypothetical protein
MSGLAGKFQRKMRSADVCVWTYAIKIIKALQEKADA